MSKLEENKVNLWVNAKIKELEETVYELRNKVTHLNSVHSAIQATIRIKRNTLLEPGLDSHKRISVAKELNQLRSQATERLKEKRKSSVRMNNLLVLIKKLEEIDISNYTIDEIKQMIA